MQGRNEEIILKGGKVVLEELGYTRYQQNVADRAAKANGGEA